MLSIYTFRGFRILPYVRHELRRQGKRKESKEEERKINVRNWNFLEISRTFA